MARLSKFRSDDARAAYLRLYDAALSASPAQVTESDVETSFGSTHVLHAGDRSKPSLVALHGSSISSTSWVPLLPVLTATHYVTMIDAIDEAGKSVAARPTTKVADITTWLDETLRAIDVQRSSFVAASRGTWIAAHYAVAFPEKVERLALLCPVWNRGRNESELHGAGTRAAGSAAEGGTRLAGARYNGGASEPQTVAPTAVDAVYASIHLWCNEFQDVFQERAASTLAISKRLRSRSTHGDSCAGCHRQRRVGAKRPKVRKHVARVATGCTDRGR